jgi:hypothetical protein
VPTAKIVRAPDDESTEQMSGVAEAKMICPVFEGDVVALTE